MLAKSGFDSNWSLKWGSGFPPLVDCVTARSLNVSLRNRKNNKALSEFTFPTSNPVLHLMSTRDPIVQLHFEIQDNLRANLFAGALCAVCVPAWIVHVCCLHDNALLVIVFHCEHDRFT